MGISIFFQAKNKLLNPFKYKFWKLLLLEEGDFILGALSVFVSIIKLKWQATRGWQKTHMCAHVYVTSAMLTYRTLVWN